MTRIFQSGESGGTRKISGAHMCSRPKQKGQLSEFAEGSGLADDLDLKSEGRRDLAGEKTTQRLLTVSLRISGVRFGTASSAIFLTAAGARLWNQESRSTNF